MKSKKVQLIVAMSMIFAACCAFCLWYYLSRQAVLAEGLRELRELPSVDLSGISLNGFAPGQYIGTMPEYDDAFLPKLNLMFDEGETKRLSHWDGWNGKTFNALLTDVSGSIGAVDYDGDSPSNVTVLLDGKPYPTKGCQIFFWRRIFE